MFTKTNFSTIRGYKQENETIFIRRDIIVDMNIEKGHFIGNGSRVISNPDGSFTVIDAGGVPFTVKGGILRENTSFTPKTDKSIKKEIKRRISFEKKKDLALIALSPIVLELAEGSSVEWVDSESLDSDLWNRVDDKNPFFVASNPNETFKKATDYLLQKKDNSVEKIADNILSGSKVRNFADRRAGFEMAKQELIELIKSKNPERFSNK